MDRRSKRHERSSSRSGREREERERRDRREREDREKRDRERREREEREKRDRERRERKHREKRDIERERERSDKERHARERSERERQHESKRDEEQRRRERHGREERESGGQERHESEEKRETSGQTDKRQRREAEQQYGHRLPQPSSMSQSLGSQSRRPQPTSSRTTATYIPPRPTEQYEEYSEHTQHSTGATQTTLNIPRFVPPFAAQMFPPIRLSQATQQYPQRYPTLLGTQPPYSGTVGQRSQASTGFILTQTSTQQNWYNERQVSQLFLSANPSQSGIIEFAVFFKILNPKPPHHYCFTLSYVKKCCVDHSVDPIHWYLYVDRILYFREEFNDFIHNLREYGQKVFVNIADNIVVNALITVSRETEKVYTIRANSVIPFCRAGKVCYGVQLTHNTMNGLRWWWGINEVDMKTGSFEMYDSIPYENRLQFFKNTQGFKGFMLHFDAKMLLTGNETVFVDSMQTKVIEKENNSSDIDMFANVCDDVVELIAAYLPLNEKIKLEGVSKQWQRCVYNKQFSIKVFVNDEDSVNNMLKQKFGCDDDWIEIRKYEFQCLLRRCVFVRTVEIGVRITDMVLQSIGTYLNHLENLSFDVFGITENGLLEFGRNYGHKLKTLRFYRSEHSTCTQLILIFLKYCPNIKHFSAFGNQSEYICEDKDILPKCENMYGVTEDNDSLDKDIDSLRIISEKYGKIIKKFDAAFYYFDRRALEYITTLVNLQQLSICVCISKYNDNTEHKIDYYIRKISENCPKLKDLMVELVYWNSDIPSNMFYAFSKFYAIKTLEIIIDQTDKPIVCMCECFKLCASLKHLKLSYSQISDEFFTDIDQHLPNLRSIDLYTIKQLTDQALISLAKLKNLKKVWLKQCYVANRLITDIGVCQLINACTRIELIWLSATPNITVTTIDNLIAIALQRNRINIKFYCDFSWSKDLLLFERIDSLCNLPNNLKIDIKI